MPERNIDTSFWNDPKVRRVGRLARELFLYLMTNPHAHVLGIYHLPVMFIERELGMPREEFEDAMRALLRADLAFYDWEREVVWVANMAKRQARSPDVWRGGRKHLASLWGSPLVGLFLDRYEYVEFDTRRGKRRPLEGAREDLDLEPDPGDPVAWFERGCNGASISADPLDTVRGPSRDGVNTVRRGSEHRVETVSGGCRDPLDTVPTRSQEGVGRVGPDVTPATSEGRVSGGCREDPGTGTGTGTPEIERTPLPERPWEGDARAHAKQATGQSKPFSTRTTPPQGDESDAGESNANLVPREKRRIVAKQLAREHNRARERLGLKPYVIRDGPVNGAIDALVVALANFTADELRNALAVRVAEVEAKRSAGVPDNAGRVLGPGMWRHRNLADDIADTPEQRRRDVGGPSPGKGLPTAPRGRPRGYTARELLERAARLEAEEKKRGER